MSATTKLTTIKSNFKFNVFFLFILSLALFPFSLFFIPFSFYFLANFEFQPCSTVYTRFNRKMASGGDECDYKEAKSIHDFTVKDTFGNDVSLEKYRGFVVLIVNIASRCGYTKKNYESMTKLQKEYHDKGEQWLNMEKKGLRIIFWRHLLPNFVFFSAKFHQFAKSHGSYKLIWSEYQTNCHVLN